MSDTPDPRLYRQRRMDPLAVLERALAPDVVAAIDALMGERVEGAVAALRAEQQIAGGRSWLPTAEAAELLGCSPAAVRMRHRRGRLQGRYQGSRLYIATESILDLGGYPARTTQAAPAAQERSGARTRKDKLS